MSQAGSQITFHFSAEDAELATEFSSSNPVDADVTFHHDIDDTDKVIAFHFDQSNKDQMKNFVEYVENKFADGGQSNDLVITCTIAKKKKTKIYTGSVNSIVHHDSSLCTSSVGSMKS